MTNTVLIKRSGTANSVPLAVDLQAGELAINYADGNLFYKNASNVVTVIASNKFSSVTGNVTGGNVLSNGQLSAAGNITGGNLQTSGQVSATGAVYALEFFATQSAPSEGGQITLSLPSSGSTLNGNVIIDVYNNQLRFFEGGGTNRGAYIDLTAAAAGVGSNLLAGGSSSTPTQIVNGTSNVVVTSSGNVTVAVAGVPTVATFTTSGITANIVAATNNGNGTNFKVGDDAWIGDINLADTMSVRGQQNAANAYIVFGNADGTQLGRAGSGPLTYGGAFSAVGNITGNYILGNGSLLTGIITSVANINNGTSNVTVVSSGGNITVGVGGTSNVVVWASTGEYVTGVISATGNITGGNLSGTSIAGTLTTASQTNITSVGTLGSLAVTANISGGNVISSAVVSAASISASGNITGGNVNTAGAISATGNITGGNITTNEIFYNSITIDNSFTTPAGFNGMVAGPVSLANGIVGTVSNGTTWHVLG